MTDTKPMTPEIDSIIEDWRNVTSQDWETWEPTINAAVDVIVAATEDRAREHYSAGEYAEIIIALTVKPTLRAFASQAEVIEAANALHDAVDRAAIAHLVQDEYDLLDQALSRMEQSHE